MSLAAGRVAAVLFLYLGVIMYSNELTALAGAFEALAKALRGEEFAAAVTVEGGKDYDGLRALCAKITAAAEAAGDLAARVAALEA